MSLPTITVVDGSKLRVSAFECGSLGKVGQKTIDLSGMAGRRVRIWLDENNQYSTDDGRNHLWQAAELDIPATTYTLQSGFDDQGLPIQWQAPVPMDLSSVPITLWPLPA